MIDWLDENIICFGLIRQNEELITLFDWADNELCNGAALHIVIEDGNYEDSNIDFCENYITSGEWGEQCKKHGWSYTTEDNTKMLRIIELMKPLSKEQREMLHGGKVITEDLFDLLYNSAANGGK